MTADWSSTTLSASGSLSVTLSNFDNLPLGLYEFQLVADNGNEVEMKNLSVEVWHPSFDAYTTNLSFPANEANGIPTPKVVLTWDENPNADNYEIEVSDNPSFANILASGVQRNVDFEFRELASNTIYYWRVRPMNVCLVGEFSETFSFQTGIEDCTNTYEATDFSNASISAGVGVFANVPITIDDDLEINRLIVETDITHSWISDLLVYIQEPDEIGGNFVTLVSYQCGDFQDLNAIFDDNGDALQCNAIGTAIRGTLKPFESLTLSSGKSSLGTWNFEVYDIASPDGGQINSASITVCTTTPNTNLPNFNNNVINVNSNDTSLITTGDIQVQTPSETASQQVYTLRTLPEKGKILKDNVELDVGGTFTQEDVDNGLIFYRNTATVGFIDAFKVDITNGANGWLPNQTINISSNVLNTNSFELANFSMFPNPSNGLISVKFEPQSSDQVGIQIFDLQGRRILEKTYDSDQSVFEQTLNLGNFANGVYLVRIHQGDRSTTKNMIVSK